MSNNTENVSSNWAGFHRLWIIVAIILLLLLLLLWLLGYGPGGKKCEVPPTIVEKTVEVEKLVDNPKLLDKISLLEKDNSKISGLMSTITGLKSDNNQISGLNVKIKALENDNSKIAGLMTTIKSLETDNNQISGLKAKIKELENVEPVIKVVEKTVEVEKIVDSPKLLNKIGILEKDNSRIAGFLTTIKGLETDNNQIAGLKAKIKALESAEPKIKIVEKIVEKIIRVPVAPTAPTIPVAPVKLMSLPNAAKLYFDVGSSEFPADINLSLSSVTAYLRNNVDSKAVISGFHDSTGSLVANQELSMKRAQAVAKLLLDSGIAIDRMTIRKPAVSTGTGSSEEARRVEVTIGN